MLSDAPKTYDSVERPAHYNDHPSQVECIEISEHLPANLSHAFGYLWRYKDKADPVQDLRKALWYLRRQREYQLSTVGARKFIHWSVNRKPEGLQADVLRRLIYTGHAGMVTTHEQDARLDVIMELVLQLLNEEMGHAPTQLELDFGDTGG